MNDGPAWDSNPQPLANQANALPTDLLGLAPEFSKPVVWYIEALNLKVIIQSGIFKCSIHFLVSTSQVVRGNGMRYMYCLQQGGHVVNQG